MASKCQVKRQVRALLLIAFCTIAASLAPVLRAQQFDPAQMAGMKWRQIGPFRGGRALTASGIPGNPNVFYFGAVSGGIWKTTNAGLTWTPIFDSQHISSIGSIAVAESDPNIIYAGTGEACIRGNISYGDGVYKSLDAGKTWSNIGLRDTRHIGAVIVDPRNPDIVFVAALGHAYGPNTERGIFRSTDGGKTWDKVLYKDDKTGGIDIVFDPHNSHVLFAALWEANRTPWSLTSGGPGSGLYKSTDGGSTWKRLEGHGLPSGVLGRIGVSVSGGDSSRVYALIEAEKGGLYRTDDAGEHWQLINEDHRFRQRAWYFTHIFADPKTVDTVYVLNTGFYRSINGGKDFDRIRGSHGDHHGLWIDPTNPDRMINTNDGGATITSDGGKSWTPEDNQPTAQFYHVAVDTRFPYYVYGAQQDNSTVAIASDTPHRGIAREDWHDVGGGESGYVVPDPTDPEIVYAGSYFGYLTRFDKRTEQAQMISPWPDDPDGDGAANLKYRFTWTTPIVFSPHDPHVLYYSSQYVFKSTDAGMSWSVISPDLSRNDKTKQQSSGGPITKDNASVEFYDLVFTIAESPRQKDLIWAGTDDGLIHLTRDGGKNWSNVTPKGIPEWSLVSLIEASPHDAGTAYAAVDGHKLDDFHPYIFKTADFGKTWKKITEGIPSGAHVHAMREDPEHKGLLFAATELGVFLSFDDGARWQSLQLNLPTVPVHDLVVKNSDLVAATHGRSFWVLDDISPLRQFAALKTTGDAVLLQPRPAVRFRADNPAREHELLLVGANAPRGASIYYWLKSAPKEKEKITLEISDSSGKVIRKVSNLKKEDEEKPPSEFDEQEPPEDSELLPARAGLNRFAWDLRHDKPREVPGAIFDEGDPIGVMAPAGTYKLKLTVAGKSYEAPLEIVPDQRIKASSAGLAKQFDLVAKIGKMLDADLGAVLEIRDVRQQLKALEKRLGTAAAAKPVLDAAKDLDKKMTAVEDELIQSKATAGEDMLNYPVKLNSKLGYLQNAVDSADAEPSAQEYELATEYEKRLNEQTEKWKEIKEKDLAALNDLMRKDNVPPVGVSAPSDDARSN
jgi:photosystem II stability/assembly factor-like uncharacterized protein